MQHAWERYDMCKQLVLKGRPNLRQKDSIKMTLKKIGFCGFGLDLSGSGKFQWRTSEKSIMNFRVP
jgi:hypothetical protein